MTRLRTAAHEETELLTVLYFPFRQTAPKETQRHRRESRQQEREETARKHEEVRRSERNADKVILAKLFRSGRLGSGRDRGDIVRRAKQLLSEFGEAERREFGPTLDRLIAAIEGRPPQAKKTSAESLRARYEQELAVRFARRYPNPTLGQKTKIEARIRVLVERAIANTQAAPETTQAKNVLVKSYERGLMERASKKLGRDLTPPLEQVLARRIQAAGNRYWDRLINLDERRPSGVGSKSAVGQERN
jgi:hypothetical protein